MKILSDITTSKLCCEVQELALKQATAEMERMRRELEQLRQVAGKARAQVEGLEQQLEEKVQAASFNLTAFEGHKASGVVSVVRALTGFSVQHRQRMCVPAWCSLDVRSSESALLLQEAEILRLRKR